MDIFDLSQVYKQMASKKIIESILWSDEKDKLALQIILFATEDGLSCKDTATAIASTIKESTDINQDMFLIIKDLVNNLYFHPTPEISALIENYFEQVGDKFNSSENIELYGELISELDSSNQLEENLP